MNSDILICTDTAKEALSKTKVAEQLVKQLRRAESHERLEIIFEVLQTLAENGKASIGLAGGEKMILELSFRSEFAAGSY